MITHGFHEYDRTCQKMFSADEVALYVNSYTVATAKLHSAKLRRHPKLRRFFELVNVISCTISRAL